MASTSKCTLCDSNVYEPIPVNGICKCKVGVLAGKICTTIPGCITAIRNSSGEFCMMCSFVKLFVLRNFTCICKDNFELKQGVCVDKCGDGNLYTLSCDDGNLNNGDGCSSSCTVEPDYVCNDGSATTPSRCIYKGMVKLELLCVYKGELLNTAQVLFQINPFVSNIAKMNLTAALLFYSSFNLSITSVAYSDRIITVDLLFNEDIEGGLVTAEFRYD
jgi:cysteine-rich repeat protein